MVSTADVSDDEDSWIPLTPPIDQKNISIIRKSIGENFKCDSEQTSTSQRSSVEQQDQQQSVKTEENQQWLLRFALFGDSNVSLVLSALLLVIALSVSWSVEGTLPFIKRWSTEELAYQKLGPSSAIAPSTIYNISPTTLNQPQHYAILSQEMRDAFERDGVIAVRGLIDTEMLAALDESTAKLVEEQNQKNNAKAREKPKVLTGKPAGPTQFFTVRQNVIFLPPEKENTTSAFVHVAMMSSIPKVVASLLKLDNPNTCSNQTVRILRDIFLAKDEEEYVCGYHVDDIGFWPALANAPGVNAWIALDDMPMEHGGGFALAVGSHKSEWRYDAYQLTGSTHSFPENGFKSSSDILLNRPGNGTCNIKETAPHLHRRMEESKRIYDIKRGDVIFHDRWLFHRTVPFDRKVVSERIAKDGVPPIYRRYSVRYGPGTSIIPPGYGTEPSVICNEANGGRTADDIAINDAAWYPKVYPDVEEDELESMKLLAVERFPRALEKSEHPKRLIRPRRNRQH